MRNASTATLVAGNWKLHLGPGKALAWTEHVLDAVRASPLPEGVHLLAFPPAVSLHTVALRLEAEGAPPPGQARPPRPSPPLALGIQQIHTEASGAFTGENSAEQAWEAGARWALVGHSERRSLFGETDAQTARRVASAYRGGLTPMLCVGETLEERKGGRLEEVLLRQLDAVLAPPGLRERVEEGPFALAYEPVWAIGTGETATPDDAAAAHALLRVQLVERLGPDRGREVPILYGGSVKPENAEELLAAPEVGGVLVGGASLDPDAFLAIARAAPSRGG